MRIVPAGNRLTVDTYVPFGDTIYWWLRAIQDQSLDTLIQDSHQYDRSYLAWETVRKRRNPYFENGTGFEGYLVGLCRTPGEALEHILQINRGMLVAILRLHRSDPRFRSKLIRVLLGESYDAQAISEWSAQLGATLARLRCNLYCNRQADEFHNETYRIIARLPPIGYCEIDESVKQVYILDGPNSRLYPEMLIDSQTLKPDDQEAWLVAESVGKFGHPLLRTFINRSLG